MTKTRVALACVALVLVAIAASAPLAAAARAAPSPPSSWRPAPAPQTTPTQHHRTHKSQSVGFGAPQQQCTACPNGNPDDKNKSLPDDKVVDWPATCEDAKNLACCACDIWVTASAQAGTKAFIYQRSDANRAKIVPTVALRGIESIASGKNDGTTNNLWKQAIDDVKILPGVPPTTVTRPVAVLNAVHTRSRHQLHIHIGQATGNFYTCFNALNTKPPAKGTFVSVDTSAKACTDVQAASTPMNGYATTAAAAGINDAIRAGLSRFGSSPGQVASDANLMRVTAFVQPQASGLYTVALIANTNDYKIFPH